MVIAHDSRFSVPSVFFSLGVDYTSMTLGLGDEHDGPTGATFTMLSDSRNTRHVSVDILAENKRVQGAKSETTYFVHLSYEKGISLANKMHKETNRFANCLRFEKMSVKTDERRKIKTGK